MMNGSGIRITGKKLQYDIEKKAGILIIIILFFFYIIPDKPDS